MAFLYKKAIRLLRMLCALGNVLLHVIIDLPIIAPAAVNAKAARCGIKKAGRVCGQPFGLGFSFGLDPAV